MNVFSLLIVLRVYLCVAFRAANKWWRDACATFENRFWHQLFVEKWGAPTCEHSVCTIVFICQ
jgi:hypothetical protein